MARYDLYNAIVMRMLRISLKDEVEMLEPYNRVR